MTGWLDADTRLFVLLNQEWTHPILDVVMPFLTDFDHWRVPVIAVLLIALARGKAEARIGILFAILAVVVADQVASDGIKPVFERPRPFKVLEDVRQLVGAHDFSFPSSHAANTFAAGVFLALRFARLRWLLILPFLVGYSRVYVGVHYPLDVIGGSALGTLIGVSFAALERASRIRLESWLSIRRLQRKDSGDEEPPSPPEDGA